MRPPAASVRRDRRPRSAATALLTVVVLAAVPLAGCVGGGGAGPGAEGQGPAAGTGNGSGPTGDGGSLNVTDADAQAHVHDRWEGAEETALFSGQVSTGSSTDLDPSDDVVTNLVCVVVCGAIAEFGPDEGEIVPPGTDRVEVTAEWSEQDVEPAVRTDVVLAYRAANMSDYQWLDAREPGATWTVNTTVEMADGGHATLSLWRFRLIATTQGGAEGTVEINLPRMANEEMTFDVTVTAHRVDGALPLEPPHPDWWPNGTDARVVLDDGEDVTAAGAGEWYASMDGCLLCRGEAVWDGSEHGPVPPETRLLVAWVNWTNDAPTADAAGVQPWLVYHDGTGFLFQPWDASVRDPGAWAFVLPVTADRTDGMYAEDQSRWTFVVGFQGTTEVGKEPVVGSSVTSPYAFDGSWSISIQAYRTDQAPGIGG